MEDKLIHVSAATIGIMGSTTDYTSYYVTMMCLWIFFIGMLGGITGYIIRNKKRHFSVFYFFGEMCLSGFAGLSSASLCYYFGILKLFGTPDEVGRSAAITSVIVGMSAHMGTRYIALLEIWVNNWFKRRSGEDVDFVQGTRRNDNNRPTEKDIPPQ